MSGDKPDELLRTPMQWDAKPGGGFTTGTPWQPMRADWQTTNVSAQENDPTSLLATYRRLIRLRASNAALGTGDFAPLAASHAAVAAFLRRDGANVVLVVANLGSVSAAGVPIAASDAVLKPGRYEARPLLGASQASSFTVAADGRVTGYVPLGTIGPLESHVFALTPAQ